MAPFRLDVLADSSPGAPLVGNNLVFYSVVGAALAALMLLALWLRRGRR